MFYLSEDSASSYRGIHPDFGRDFAKKLINATGTQKGGTILDIGTGTGQLTTSLQIAAPGAYNLIALDASSEMLTHAKRNFQAHAYSGLRQTSPVTVINAPAHQTGLRDNSVDVLIVANTIHWLFRDEESQNATCKEFARIARETATAICVTGRPKKDDFWQPFLRDLKAHPRHDANSAFALTRERHGGKEDIAKQIIYKPELFETSLQVLVISPQDAANYCKSISPYANIPQNDIDTLAEKHFQSAVGDTGNIWVSHWLFSAFVGSLKVMS